MLQSILAVIGGFIAMAVIVMITTAIAATLLVPGGMPATATSGAPLPRAYLAANLLCSALAAWTGGMITARIAPVLPMVHAATLAALMVAMSVLSMRQAGDRQPRAYQLTLLTVMPAVAILGAWSAITWWPSL